MPEMSERVRDDGRRLDDFAYEILVVCPECEGRAVTRPKDREATGWALANGPRRVACSGCGFVAEALAPARRRTGAESIDDHFGLTLWLCTRCSGEELWAYNEAHLDWLETFVAAHHREREAPSGGKWTMATRLPRWMKAKENRADILAKLAKLRTRLPAE